MTLRLKPVELQCDQCQLVCMFQETVDFKDYQDLFILIDSLGWKKHHYIKGEGYKHLCPECLQEGIERFKKLKERSKEELFSIAEAPDQLSPAK